jgi:glyoxylase-like metal-dependent hydrolase (beta-lactamase superfamily II)
VHLQTKAIGVLAEHIRVFERGWLSSNNVLLVDGDDSVLVDTGYATHAMQTVQLVNTAMSGKPLRQVVNTHLHSDHCGGNAALTAAYPELRISIPPGQFDAVVAWDSAALTHSPTGQQCPAFKVDGKLERGVDIVVGSRRWQVHAAPGHDPHSVVLFEEASRSLISADALWENGFGVVFPELEGVDSFSEVGETLDLIEALAPSVVIPGHGRVFTDVVGALARARARLAYFVSNPRQHAKHAAKVLIKFHLLAVHSQSLASLTDWLTATDYLADIHKIHFSNIGFAAWTSELLREMGSAGALNIGADWIDNS